jgi:hypothetical protein
MTTLNGIVTRDHSILEPAKGAIDKKRNRFVCLPIGLCASDFLKACT